MFISKTCEGRAISLSCTCAGKNAIKDLLFDRQKYIPKISNKKRIFTYTLLASTCYFDSKLFFTEIIFADQELAVSPNRSPFESTRLRRHERKREIIRNTYVDLYI